MSLSEILNLIYLTEIERKTIQGEEDLKHHLKATAQPGGHAARTGEYSKESGVLRLKKKKKVYTDFSTAATKSSQFSSTQLVVVFCHTGDAGEVEAAADLLLKSLLKEGLHLLEGWCVDVKYLWLMPTSYHCTPI